MQMLHLERIVPYPAYVSMSHSQQRFHGGSVISSCDILMVENKHPPYQVGDSCYGSQRRLWKCHAAGVSKR